MNCAETKKKASTIRERKSSHRHPAPEDNSILILTKSINDNEMLAMLLQHQIFANGRAFDLYFTLNDVLPLPNSTLYKSLNTLIAISTNLVDPSTTTRPLNQRRYLSNWIIFQSDVFNINWTLIVYRNAPDCAIGFVCGRRIARIRRSRPSDCDGNVSRTGNASAIWRRFNITAGKQNQFLRFIQMFYLNEKSIKM